MYGVDQLLSVFPDAVIIQTHRNPLEVPRSSLQLNEVLEGGFAYPGDRAQTGTREARILIESIDSVRSLGKALPEFAGRFIDVHYDKLISEGLESQRLAAWCSRCNVSGTDFSSFPQG